jgi:hypothetical protein
MAGKSAARDALLEEIRRQVENLPKAKNLSRSSEASTIRDLALAFRYVEGGPQPGGASGTA